MIQYKFYFLDERGHIFRAQDHLLRDDTDALAVARNLSSSHIIEIWERARSIGRVKPDGKLLDDADRLSG